MTIDELKQITDLYNSIDRLDTITNALSNEVPVFIYAGSISIELPYYLRPLLKEWMAKHMQIAKSEFENIQMK